MSGALSIVCVGDGVLCTLLYSRQVPEVVYTLLTTGEEESFLCNFYYKVVWKIMINWGFGLFIFLFF